DLRIKQNTFFAVLERCKDYKIEYFDGEGNPLGTDQFVTKCNPENEEVNKIKYLGKYRLIVNVADAESLVPLDEATIELIDPETNTVVASYTTDKAGTANSDYLENKAFGYKFKLDVHISRENYLTQTFVMESELGKTGTLTFDYLLHKREVGTDIGKVFNLNPIYFDFSKWNIREDAATELDKIVLIMNENPEIKIELGSHTDCRSSRAFNKRLSTKRAKSSSDYIQERITNPSRIYGKGYGEAQLINQCECEGNDVVDCTEEEHQANRRTEFTVVK
ncbi:MAG: outer membrane protein OmpA-like peptidoglycan-associated protein, partial [Flavobacteriaceae bacterium]